MVATREEKTGDLLLKVVNITDHAQDTAIELNGVDIERNIQTFSWGRKYYEDAAWVEAQAQPRDQKERAAFDRVAELRDYQNEAYAQNYVAFVEAIQEPALKETVAKYLYKLMAYKDEYEVARLLTKPAFEQKTKDMWAAPESISYNLHPPMLRAFGLNKKMKFGPWFRTPLLIHSSTNDEDVNVLEVEHLVAALKAAGKTFEHKIYKDAPGGHEFNRLDTKLAKESRAEVYRFLAKYLTPPNPVK